MQIYTRLLIIQAYVFTLSLGIILTLANLLENLIYFIENSSNSSS